MGAIRLEIPSDRHMVDLAEVLAVRVARIHRMPDGQMEDFGLAVRESVINAIVHGNREVSTRRVSIGGEWIYSTREDNAASYRRLAAARATIGCGCARPSQCDGLGARKKIA